MTSISEIINGNKNRALGKLRRVMSYLKAPSIAAAAVLVLDISALIMLFGSLSQVRLVLVLLLEGSVGLISSTVIALSSTPSISKLGEITLKTAQWSREGEKNAEKVAGKWIIASAILIAVGFLLSAL